METRRLRRIKPQPVPDRRLLWLRRNRVPARPQSEQEEVTSMLTLLDHARRFRWPLVPQRSVWGVISLVALFWSVGMAYFAVPVALLTTVLVTLFTGLLLTRLTVSRQQLYAIQRLTGSDDLRAIPPLVAALDWPEASARNASAIALMRLLPRLQPVDASVLDPLTRSRLQRRLGRRRRLQQQELAIAILKALEQVGEAGDLHSGQVLTERRAVAEGEQRVR